MILVTGANGTIGHHVVTYLATEGYAVRAMVRNVDKAKRLEAPNVEITRGDFSQVSSLAAALAGVDATLLLTATSPSRVAQEANFIQAARRAGTKHIVRLSILGADETSPSRVLQRHGAAETLLLKSGIPYTLLRPSYFMQNLFWYAEDIRSRGVFQASLPETTRHSHVDARDVAKVAVATLTDVRHVNQVYRVTGPDAQTYPEMMAVLSGVLGKRTHYDSLAEHYAHSLTSWGLDAEEILELDACIAQGVGDGAMITNTVLQVTGNQPASFEQFAKAHVRYLGGNAG
jgi:uncharacterized protein YbjT (DUF2867 family)